jgi:hypothetical protein
MPRDRKNKIIISWGTKLSKWKKPRKSWNCRGEGGVKIKK